MNGTLKVIIDVVSTPAILVALIALFGLALQKKSVSDCIKGTIKTFVGFLVVVAAAGIIENSLSPFGAFFQKAFNIKGVVPSNEAIVSIAITQLGSITALIMLFGMLLNILFARITNFKYIYLTGHATLYMACMLAAILSVTDLPQWAMVAIGGVFLGIANTVFPAVTQPFTRQITKNDQVALGHTGDLGYALSGLIGKLFSENKKSTEDIKFPKNLSFLRDSTVGITLTMGIVYIVVAICAGSDFVEGADFSKGTNFIVYAVIQAGTFAAGIFVILAGVRMILSEIVPAFQGISMKLVPKSIPALDCPIIFPYAPNAVLIGFFSSFAGGVISLAIMIASGLTAIIPGVVPHFFCGATAGVFGNSSGGIKGCVAGAFTQGVVISFMPLALMPLLGGLGFQDSTFSDSDYGVVGLFVGGANLSGGSVAILIALGIALMLLFGASAIKGRRKVVE